MTKKNGIDLPAFAKAFTRLMEEVHRVAPREQASRLARSIKSHLGVDPAPLPIVEEGFADSDHPNVQLAMERLAAEGGEWKLLGLPVDVLHWSGFGLSNLASPVQHGPSFEAVAPAYVNVPIGVDETLPCVTIGIWLLRHEGTPLVVLTSLGDPHHGSSGLKVEVMCAARDDAVSCLARLRALAHELNVYRGKVLSFNFSEWGAFGLEFHRLPQLTRDDLILPEADLDAIERHTIGVAAHAEKLRDAGRHLKRGLLLFGPPGTGKTFSVMYLCAQMPARTTILLSGQAAPTLGQAAAIARSLQPAMLVLEDVDLVAMERTMPGMGSNPLLFQLLNEMDGLEEDADVIFVLTTNRVELLEPALAARPGRIDQAVEIRLPDDACRRRLLARYLEGMNTEVGALDDVIERTEGVSAAFLKELTRRAALVAAEAAAPDEALVVRDADVVAALDDMLEHSAPIVRSMLGAARDDDDPPAYYEAGPAMMPGASFGAFGITRMMGPGVSSGSVGWTSAAVYDPQFDADSRGGATPDGRRAASRAGSRGAGR
jgi:cell division protease FtsH